jgi:hypothetical protein
MSDSGGSSEDHNAHQNFSIKTGLMRFHMEMKTPLGIRVEVIHITFWQEHIHIFVHVLIFCVRLSLKVKD